MGGRRVHFERDVALTANESGSAKCPEELEIRRSPNHREALLTMTEVGADIEVADSVHDPLAR